MEGSETCTLHHDQQMYADDLYPTAECLSAPEVEDRPKGAMVRMVIAASSDG